MSISAAIGAGAGVLLIAAGLALLLGGAIGMLRFPDLYTRAHAVTAGDGAGALLVLGGLAVSAGDAAMAIRLLLLGALLIALRPVLTHLIVSAAHAAGLAPIAGRYTAPRPGAGRGDGAP
jgi:multicomponent Na+:H+ antiporter subunit G